VANAGQRSSVGTEKSPAGERHGALAGKVVLLDPGHNGGNFAAPEIINRLVPAGRGHMKPCNTTGTETDNGYTEAAFNWDVALRLRRILVGEGARVVLTRHSNTGVGPCVNERAAIGNRAHADAAIAIHADGGPPDGRGFQVIYAPDEGSTAPTFASSLRLAHSVHAALLASGVLVPSTYDGQHGYSVRNDLAGLNLSTRPAILVELGNMRNSADAALQADPAVRQQLADALARGLRSFLVGGA
jgi:N-acetylmuramoyl-L-alanine amidase